MKIDDVIILIICISIIIGLPSLVIHGNNYVDESNKVTSDIIITKIIVKDEAIFNWDQWGYGYYMITDTYNRGYYTIIGKTFNFKKGDEYNISYFCDKNDIRRIVSADIISPNKQSIKYTCDVGECKV